VRASSRPGVIYGAWSMSAASQGCCRVQRVVERGRESWTVIGEDRRAVVSVDHYLAWLTHVERSPNTVRAYASDLKKFVTFLAIRDVRWDRVSLETLGEFTAWLRRRRDEYLGGGREASVRRQGAGVDPHRRLAAGEDRTISCDRQSLARGAELEVGGLVFDAVQRFALHSESNPRRGAGLPGPPVRGGAGAGKVRTAPGRSELRRGRAQIRRSESGRLHQRHGICRGCRGLDGPRRRRGKYAAATRLMKARSLRGLEFRDVYSGT
jgi:hypothetical protein